MAPGGWYERRVFNPLMDRLLAGEELADERRGLLAGLTGAVLEVGIGTGLNLPHYPAARKCLWVLSPEAELDPRTRRRAGERGLELEHVRGWAEEIPLEDALADAVVCTFVLCSVRDPLRALTEFARVLRPGGTLRLIEHVLSPRHLERAVQRAITPLWKHVACGCRLDRDAGALVRACGFSWQRLSIGRSKAVGFPASELLCGVARAD